MPVERREQAIAVELGSTGVIPGGTRMFNGRRQPSCDGTSRMTRECQVRICERLGVKFPGPTRQTRPLDVLCSMSGLPSISGPPLGLAVGLRSATTGLMQCSKISLFDHFVGAQQDRLGEFQPKRLGGLSIDHQFELHRL